MGLRKRDWPPLAHSLLMRELAYCLRSAGTARVLGGLGHSGILFRSDILMFNRNWLAIISDRIFSHSIARSIAFKRKSHAQRYRCADVETLEDRMLLTVGSNGTIASSIEISSGVNGGPVTNFGDLFGGSVTSIGDFNHDGISDLAVGAPLDDTGGTNRGAAYILMMNTDGTVQSSIKIANSVSGGPVLPDNSEFGSAVSAIGDLNGDGVTDLAVGAQGDDVDGRERGAVYVLFMNQNGTVQSSTRIASSTNGGPKLAVLNHFGHSLAAIGDIDGDGVADLAVGAPDGQDGATASGSVYVLFLNANGSVHKSTKIQGKQFDLTFNPANGFGSSIAAIGDVNGDGLMDLGVGGPRGNHGRGMVFLMTLSKQGKASFLNAIGPELNEGFVEQGFGVSLSDIGDQNNDGFDELAIGAASGGMSSTTGAIYIASYGSPSIGNVNLKRIANDFNGGPSLSEGDHFGISVAAIGDLNGDGISEIAVGAQDSNSNHALNGALHILFPAATDQVPTVALNSNGPITFTGVSQPVAIAPNLTFNDADTDQSLQVPGGTLFIELDAAANKKGTKIYDTLETHDPIFGPTPLTPMLIAGRFRYYLPVSNTLTDAQIQDTVRSITFSTTKTGLSKPTRTVSIQIQDQAGGTSSVVTQTINVKKS
jgi:hypothetical protein